MRETNVVFRSGEGVGWGGGAAWRYVWVWGGRRRRRRRGQALGKRSIMVMELLHSFSGKGSEFGVHEEIRDSTKGAIV